MEILKNHPLAPYTTIKIGGPADNFIITHTTKEFVNTLKKCVDNETNEANKAQESETISRQESNTENSFTNYQPITILGNGSNVLISDSGIRGTVIKNSSQEIEIVDESPTPTIFNHTYTQRKENEPDKYLDFSKIDYNESSKPQILVKISSGTPLPYAINYLLDQGTTGLQWFAYRKSLYLTKAGQTYHHVHG